MFDLSQTTQAPFKRSIGMAFKAFIIGGLTLVILVALALINTTISSRQAYRNEAVASIAESYAGAQTIIGPVLIRPFTVESQSTVTDDKGGKRTVEHSRSATVWCFPHELNVSGILSPSERRHGLYKVPVYELAGHLTGSINVTDAVLQTGESAADVTYGTPYLALAVSDVRGIVGSPNLTVNTLPVQLFQGSPDRLSWQPNLQAPLRVAPEGLHGQLAFALDLTLAGTGQLNIAPVGDTNHIQLSSTWPSPLFAGRFLPRTRTIGSDGFKAEWDISSLASATQLQMINGDKPHDQLNVSLTDSIDPYKLSDRAVKYGILFVLITFGGFFLFENIKRLPIHPVQYLLVGLGLAIFFLLLISFSEHIPFGAAYLLASAGCIGLLTFYLTFVLHNLSYGLTFGGLLTSLYAATYGLLLSEDNALVLGSIMLFALLALTMYLTRNVDWYNTGNDTPTPRPAPPPPTPAVNRSPLVDLS